MSEEEKIYTREKMKQKTVYPTEQTPSYADWALYEMGKDLEDKVDSIPEGAEYTAGSGISISEENVISNTAQPDVTKSYVDGVDINLQQQIDAIVASSDVKDIVGTYAALQAYDTTTLGNNDIIKVLVDSTHNDAMGYYRWVITEGVGAWSYIGSEGPYYTKSQVDTELLDKLDKDFSNADVGQATAGQVLKVNASANGVEFANPTKELPTIATGDAGKVLTVNSGETGVEWASIAAGGGYEFVESRSDSGSTLPGASRSISISIDINHDYIIFTIPNDTTYVEGIKVTNRSTITINYYNKSGSQSSIGVSCAIYRRPKVGTTNIISVIGSVGRNCKFIESGGSSGQVFKKTGSNYAQGMWQDIKEVPIPASSDAGKVLGATGSNAYGWITPPGGAFVQTTPVSSLNDLAVGDVFTGTIYDAAYTYVGTGIVTSLGVNVDIAGVFYDSGNQLTINHADHIDSISGVKYVPAQSLPALANNANKVLKVNAQATGVEWATASGGGKTAVSLWSDLSVGDIFIGKISESESGSTEVAISGIVTTIISGGYYFEGTIIESSMGSNTVKIMAEYDSSSYVISNGYKL